VWAYASGAVLIAAGVTVAAGKKLWLAGVVSGTMILVWALFRHIPHVASDAHLGVQWTHAGKALALFGGALAVAASEPGGSRGRLVFLGRVCLGAFMALAGIQHFLFPGVVAQLVPTWIPAPLFWTYFAGVALIFGGVGLMPSWTARPAAALSGLMVFSWLVLLHIPRAVVAPPGPQRRNEWTAVFEALAVSGIAFVLAGLGARLGTAERGGTPL
jgi:uncharacterized membrane protein YphA (DoxX/SURF4 family)